MKHTSLPIVPIAGFQCSVGLEVSPRYPNRTLKRGHCGAEPTRIRLQLGVAKILGDGRRKRTRAFTESLSHYLFEGMVGYARRNFLGPIPRAESFAVLNVHLEQKCLALIGVDPRC